MDLLLDDTWDLEVGATDLSMVTGADGVRQHLAQRLKTFAGEWFLDRRIGVPYLQQVMVKNPDPVVLDSAFKAEIIATPGIEELMAFELAMDAAARQLQLSFVAQSIEGPIIYNEVLP
jgi:hypothetical protein